MKKFIKQILPDSITHLLTSRKSNWYGDFESWDEAKAKCSGYDATIILEKVKDAVLKVKSGNAVYERDSVLFDKIEYSWPLLALLLFVSVKQDGRLHVLDFGGSLGSSYFQNKLFLDQLKNVNWDIVEQPDFVNCGREFIQSEIINFFMSAEEAIASNGLPDLLMFSTTLPYLEQPYEILSGMMKFKIPFILIDNTIFNYEARDRLTIQKVPKSIYEADYPCWFLDYDKVKGLVESRYQIISEHQNEHTIELEGNPVRFRGFFGKLKNS